MSEDRRIINVGIDFDGVLTNFTEMFILCAYNKLGSPLDLDPSHVKAWRFEDWYPITKDQVALVWEEFSSKPRVWERLRSLDKEGADFLFDTMHFIQLHTDIDFNVHFITHRHNGGGESIVEQSAYWVEQNLKMNFISWEVVQTDDKGTEAKNRDLNFFIDDLPQNCMEVKNAYPLCRTFLRIREWNKYAIDTVQKENIIATSDLRQFTYAMMSHIRKPEFIPTHA